MKDASPSGFRIRGLTSAMRLRGVTRRCTLQWEFRSHGQMRFSKASVLKKLCFLNSTSTETMRSCVTESVPVTFHRKSSEDNFYAHSALSPQPKNQDP